MPNPRTRKRQRSDGGKNFCHPERREAQPNAVEGNAVLATSNVAVISQVEATSPHYSEILRRHKRRTKQISEQSTMIQIAIAPGMLTRIAVTRAETLKANAIKKPKKAPIRALNPIS